MAPSDKSSTLTVTQDMKEAYEDNGYVVVPGFLSPEEILEMKADISRLTKIGIEDSKNSPSEIVSATGTQVHLESQNQAHVFFEPGALKDGHLVVPENQSIHKIGHGVHLHSRAAQKITYSDKMKTLIKEITGFINPVQTQGMYLLKQPKIGAKREIHQDETYLMTRPQGKVFGIWVALDHATTINGCLDFIPGSHKTFTPLNRLYGKYVDQDQIGDNNNFGDKKVLDYIGDAPYLHDNYASSFVRVPVKAGDLVLLHGLVVHKSEPNLSNLPRGAYTFHCYDKIPGVEWLKENQWQELDHDHRFVPLYEGI